MRNEKWWWRLRREYIWGDARRLAMAGFPRIASLPRIVIPSVVEGSFLHWGQYHIGVVYLSARKISRFARNDDTGV